MIIKIDRSTIVKNIEYNSGKSKIQGRKRAFFVIKGDKPKLLVDGKNCVITKEYFNDNKFEGEFTNANYDCSKLFKYCTENNILLEVTYEYDLIDYYGFIQSRYFFKYEKKKIECRNCGKKVNINKIIRDRYGKNDQECPKCGAINSFKKIEYENIDDVVKELKIND